MVKYFQRFKKNKFFKITSDYFKNELRGKSRGLLDFDPTAEKKKRQVMPTIFRVVLEYLFPLGSEIHVLESRSAFMGSTRPANNISNGTYGNNSCNLLVDNSDLKDGKIPELLAIALTVWLVRSRSCVLFVTAYVSQLRRKKEIFVSSIFYGPDTASVPHTGNISDTPGVI